MKVCAAACVGLLILCAGVGSAEEPEADGGAAVGEQDALVVERDALRAEVSTWRGVMDGFRERKNALREQMRKALKSEQMILDPATVEDEELAAKLARIQALEAELLTLREAVKQAVDEQPEQVARRERVAQIHASMEALRTEQQAFEKANIDKMRRLKQVEDELAAREAQAAAAAEAAGAEQPADTADDVEGGAQ